MPPKAPARRPPGSANSSAPSTSRRKAAPDASWSLPALPDSILMRPPSRWCVVHAKLQHINLLDDVFRLPPDATFNTLESRLISHHGGAVRGIDMYKDDTQPKNRIRDFSKTLKEVFGLDDARPSTVPYPNIPSASGVGPALVLSPEDHHVTVCYDFKSHDSDCPLLNRSPRYKMGNLDALVGGAGHGGGASPGSTIAGGGGASSVGRSAGGGTSTSGGAGAGAGAGAASTGSASAAAAAAPADGSSSGVSLSAPLAGAADGASVGVGGGGAGGSARGGK